MENDIDIDIFDEALETIEPREDYNSYSEVIENDQGQTFTTEERDYWTGLINEAKELIDQGQLSSDNALEVVQGVYGEYLQQRDIEEAFNQGLKPSDISKEAWKLYEQNIGKMTIAQCMEATDPFLYGFEDGANRNRSYKRVTKHKLNPFLDGFDSYGK